MQLSKARGIKWNVKVPLSFHCVQRLLKVSVLISTENRYKGGMADLPVKVPLHKCSQHGQQTGGAGSHCSARKLGSNCHHCNMVGGIKGLVIMPTRETALWDKGAEPSWQIFKEVTPILWCKRKGEWHGWIRSCRSNEEARRKWKGGESRDRYPGKSIAMLLSCVWIGQKTKV